MKVRKLSGKPSVRIFDYSPFGEYNGIPMIRGKYSFDILGAPQVKDLFTNFVNSLVPIMNVFLSCKKSLRFTRFTPDASANDLAEGFPVWYFSTHESSFDGYSVYGTFETYWGNSHSIFTSEGEEIKGVAVEADHPFEPPSLPEIIDYLFGNYTGEDEECVDKVAESWEENSDSILSKYEDFENRALDELFSGLETAVADLLFSHLWLNDEWDGARRISARPNRRIHTFRIFSKISALSRLSSQDSRYKNKDGTFKKMTCPDNPEKKSKFCGCVRYQMHRGYTLEQAKKICGYIKNYVKKGQAGVDSLESIKSRCSDGSLDPGSCLCRVASFVDSSLQDNPFTADPASLASFLEKSIASFAQSSGLECNVGVRQDGSSVIVSVDDIEFFVSS